MIAIEFPELKKVVFDKLLSISVRPEKAEILANVMAESTLDGVNSHGVNRLPLLFDYIEKGVVDINAEPEIVNTTGFSAQVDGKSGFGILNALFATDLAIEKAEKEGIGLVALRNTNHWLRAGTYGWRAAEKSKILICWTNTLPNVPPYGSKEKLIGNNPFVVAIPRREGHVVLDMATSQFSYGKVAIYAREGKELPVPGGYDEEGNLTTDASRIRNGGRHLPIGYWKGSSFTFVLDMLAAILSGGNSTYRIGEQGGVDTGMSQVYIAIDPDRFGGADFREDLLNETIQNFKEISAKESSDLRYPGEETLKRRNHNLKHGIEIEEEIWKRVQAL